MKYINFFILTILLFSCNNAEKDDSNLSKYLTDNWLSPTDYVLSKFNNHDYVFIGEYHRIKHDVDLINSLIPKLYDNGIYNLAIEFGDYKDQYLVDSLLALPKFDRQLARKIVFDFSPSWGFKEYIDLYENAWNVNQRSDEKKFRIVNLGAHFDPCKKGGAWADLDPDIFMGKIILDEIVSKNEKALIYSGQHHAFTKYHQPIYLFDKDSLYGFNDTRMGNVVYDSVKQKAFNIYLHAAWVSKDGWDKKSVLPVNGVIDSIMDNFNNHPVGFDVVASPFGKLTSLDSYYSLGYDNFSLDNFCDGYIYQGPFSKYEPVTMEIDFITKENIESLKQWLLCLREPNSAEWKKHVESITIDNANEQMFEDIRNHFKHLMKE